MGEVIPRTEYLLKLSEKEYKVIAACVAQCAGIKTRVSPQDANEVNLMLVSSQARYLEQQAVLAKGKETKAKEHVVKFCQPDESAGQDHDFQDNL